MRLTKDDCNKIAKQLLQKRYDEFDIKVESLKIALKNYFISKTPDIIKQGYSENPTYFTKISFSLGIDRRSFLLDVPSVYKYTITIADTDSSLVKKHGELNALFSKIKQTEEALKAHLYSLRTLEKVKRQFPDVAMEEKPKTTNVSIITPNVINWLK